MEETRHRQWLWILLAGGIAYLIIGQVFAFFAGAASSANIRLAWRLAAWILSAVLFALHIRCERMRFHSTAKTTALRTSFAVGLGAFLIAVVAFARTRVNSAPLGLRALALVLFPLITMLPAFLVSFVLAATFWKPRHSTASEANGELQK